MKSKPMSTEQHYSRTAACCCVIDLDQTVLTREPITKDPFAGLRLYIGRETEKGDVTGDIMNDCKNTIRGCIANGWNFVAVTARWGGISRCRENTENWLRAHEMEMPVYYATMPYPTDGPRAAFKAGVIREIQRSGEFGNVLVGIGDRPSDIKAYLDTDIVPIVVKDALGEVEGGAEAHLRKIQSLEARYEKKVTYVQSDETGSAWAKIEGEMQRIRDYALC